MLVAAPRAQAALVFDGAAGSGAPPKTLGGYAMTPAPQDTRPDGSFVGDAPASSTSTFSFDKTMWLLSVGAGWCSSNWAGGSYSGRVYYSRGASSVTITLPSPSSAVYFYADPDQFGTFNMQATAQDGTSVSSGLTPISNEACGSATASGQFFGFYGTGGEKIQSIAVSFVDSSATLTDFAVGDFALGSSAPPEQPITASGTTLSATEGKHLTAQTVASFSGDSDSAATDFSTTIDWGDGSAPSAGTVVSNGSGGFDVLGDHTYREESGSSGFPVKVDISDSDTPTNTATANSTATVADAPLSSSCAAPATSPEAFSTSTATFTDADAGAIASDYKATIDWGDGSSSGGALAGGPGSAPYTVSGSHTYASTGTYTITATVNDAGGSQTVTTCKVLVFAFPSADGAFVIADKNGGNGAQVTFWGPQWWKLNSFSGGGAPASFKGFAASAATPRCGVRWSGASGDSVTPPNGPLPADMAVIVSSHPIKSGSVVSGDVAHIVVVKTNPGYQPNDGSSGSGTVEAQVC